MTPEEEVQKERERKELEYLWHILYEFNRKEGISPQASVAEVVRSQKVFPPSKHPKPKPSMTGRKECTSW